MNQRAIKSSAIKGVDSKLASLILDEIVEGGVGVLFDDIAGLAVRCYDFYFNERCF